MASAVDACGDPIPNVASAVSIVYVTSDEVEDAPGSGENGDGHTCKDIVLVDDHTVQVRAERDGTSNGRLYTIHYTVSAGGQTTTADCFAEVPHDQGPHPVIDDHCHACVGTGCPCTDTTSACP